MEVKGVVKKIIFHNESNGFSIFSLELGGKKEDPIICTGNIEPLEECDYVEVCGEEVIHPEYGKQLKASYIRKVLPTDTSLFSQYLSSSIKGLGEKLADKIVDALGEKTFEIIEKDYERLAEIRGISPTKAQSINNQFMAQNMSRDEQLFYLSLGISDTYITKIKKTYGDETKKVLCSNPYKLIDDVKGIGFKKADEIAKKNGIPNDSIYRLYHGVLYLMETYASEKGFDYIPKELLIANATKLLKVDKINIEQILPILIDDDKLVEDNSNIYLSIYNHMESYVAEFLIKKKNEKTKNYDQNSVMSKIKAIEKQNNVNLDDTQREAVYKAIAFNLLIMTGGPGTGKTTTISTMLNYFEKYEKKYIELAAPTGRAAKRMSEQTKHDAQTVHRLIGAKIEDDEVIEDLDIDADVVIIDEMSMVDISLMYMLVKKIREGTKVIFVGDVDQLPSVGPGCVLKDMISSEMLPVARLTKVHRQDEGSTIIPNAHKINEGIDIDLNEKSNDFFFVRRNDPNIIIRDILILMQRNMPHHLKCKPLDIQVLAPMRKGPLGVNNLNKILQEKLNPLKNKKQIVCINTIYREGDKVMQIKNNYKKEWINGKEKGLGVFNGDTGCITSVNEEDETLTVLFDDGRCIDYGKDDLKELELAYAITIHKSQGSEYPGIIIPIISGGPPMLYNKNLLYTAVTRAKDCVVMMGKGKYIHMMIGNKKATKRYSGLCEKIMNMSS